MSNTKDINLLSVVRDGKRARDELLGEMKATIAELSEKNEKLEKDLFALKKQAEATNKEYDRLTGEYAELQNKYNRIYADFDKTE